MSRQGQVPLHCVTPWHHNSNNVMHAKSVMCTHTYTDKAKTLPSSVFTTFTLAEIINWPSTSWPMASCYIMTVLVVVILKAGYQSTTVQAASQRADPPFIDVFLVSISKRHFTDTIQKLFELLFHTPTHRQLQSRVSPAWALTRNFCFVCCLPDYRNNSVSYLLNFCR